MAQHNLRTYSRRGVTRQSGYHTCDETTGGECIIVHAAHYKSQASQETFTFRREQLDLTEVFGKNISIIAFGGYIYSENKANVKIELQYIYEGEQYSVNTKFDKVIEPRTWTNIGAHIEQKIDKETTISNVSAKLCIETSSTISLDFVSFDFDVISKAEFSDTSCLKSFYQKTYLHIPYLYYLKSDLPFERYLISKQQFSRGKRIVLKSCNRCGRFLPINIEDELKTLSFSLHCKKKAPCVHSTFRAYNILNINNLSEEDLEGLSIEENKVVSYYGHQLECKACKKFFVNAPLNPQRNAQQFKEDGLRRRAIEVLVNHLLNKNLVHFEFEKRTKKEFSRYIWEKFGKRCFKCGPNSKPIKLEEMALDHTMPLAYLYRLDETATCLCSSHNSQKSDTFPVDYYTPNELKRLSKITGLSLAQLQKKEVNRQVLNLLISNVDWYYDSFLMDPDYQKVRDGILTADKINDSLKRVIGNEISLEEKYKEKTGKYPTSVTMIKKGH